MPRLGSSSTADSDPRLTLYSPSTRTAEEEEEEEEEDKKQEEEKQEEEKHEEALLLSQSTYVSRALVDDEQEDGSRVQSRRPLLRPCSSTVWE